MVLSLFFVLLISGWVFATYPVSNIIVGMLESEQVIDNRIDLENLSIIFDDYSLELINFHYFEEQKTEFSLCLMGEVAGAVCSEGLCESDYRYYFVKDLYKPKTFAQSFSQVTHESCNASTIIMFHTHPYKSCLPSDTDLNTLASAKKLNPDLLMTIMCEPKRFNVIS